MKQISMREFQLNAPKYLKELPIELTRYKEVVAVVHLKVSELEPHHVIKVENVGNTGVVEKPEPIVVESKLEKFQKLKEQIEGGYVDIGKKIAPDGFKVSTEEQEDEQFKKYIDEPQVIYSKEDL